VPYAKKQAPLAARIENSRDPLSLEDRFRLMSKVRAVDTEPEIRVRRLVHALAIAFVSISATFLERQTLYFRD
jgi:G:T-mismatch repair DNA endonuclease (very short patch repair protein)